MSQRLAPAALNACLRTHFHTSLSADLILVGIDLKYLKAETLSTKIVGRLARLHSITPERLVELTQKLPARKHR
jgi:hypothetical protein